jgi:hypothetical protein
MHIRGDWEHNAQVEHVGERAQKLLQPSTHAHVKVPVKVRRVLLLEAAAGTHGVLLVVAVERAGAEEGHVNAATRTRVGHVELPHHVHHDGFGLVSLAPVDARATGNAGGADHVLGAHAIEKCCERGGESGEGPRWSARGA